MRFVAGMFLLALAAPVFGGQFETTPGPVFGGTRAAVDLPTSQHMRNVGGTDGAGLCVPTSIQHAARWQGLYDLDGYRRYCEGLPGGSYPSKTDQTLAGFCSRKGIPVPSYIQHTGGDDGFLDLAVKTGRCPGVTYSGSDGFYRGRVAHMVSLAHLDGERAAIVDNNRPGSWVWMSRRDFLVRWRDMQGGWAFVFLAAPPAPHPVAPSIVFAGCPGGVCPIRPTVAPVAADPLGPNPVGNPPGPGFRWRQLPGVGWGWVHDSVPGGDPIEAKPEPVTVAGEDVPTGVVPEKIHEQPAYSINGVPVDKDTAMSAMGGLSDDSGNWNLSVVGDPAFLARVRADVAGLPIEARGKLHVQAYTPDVWQVSHFRLAPGVTLRRPAVGRVGADVGTIAAGDYTPAKLLDLCCLPTGPTPRAPAGPKIDPPNPNPTPAPDQPNPTPADPHVPGWCVVCSILAAIAYWLMRKR